jgi:FixJ family two-component response regulator
MRNSGAGRTQMIFIVDDDGAVRESLRFLLDCVGLETREFASAEEFLDGRDADDTECLILDVHMPGMSGLDLLEELRRRNDQVPVIVVTGRSNAVDTARALTAGAVAVLEKPFNPAEIIALAQTAVGKIRNHR